MNLHSALLAQFKDAAENAAIEPLEEELPVEQELSSLDPIISAALLVSSAFRMRDEGALIATLRLLTNAVADWEATRPEPANDA
jgi:hypothetical protein